MLCIQYFLVLVIVTVNAKHFPIAAIRRIVVVIVILVMDGKFFQVFPRELPGAGTADMGEQAKGSFPVPCIPLCHITAQFRQHACPLLLRQYFAFLYHGCWVPLG